MWSDQTLIQVSVNLLRTYAHGARIVFIYRPHGEHCSIPWRLAYICQSMSIHVGCCHATPAGLSREAVIAISRQLQSAGMRHFSIQPAFRPTKATAERMHNGRTNLLHQPAMVSKATAQAAAAQTPHGCERCKSHGEQVVSVLTLSASDAIWPLLAAVEVGDDPAAQAIVKHRSQSSNGRHAEEHKQPPTSIDLAKELVRVAGPAAALEPHIVLV